MRLERVLLAHAARFVSLATANLYIRDAVRLLQERYDFVQVPTTPEELLPEQGQPLLFEHGRLVHAGRSIVIHKFQIYQQALVAETGLTTDDSDIVLDDLIQAGSERGLIRASGAGRIYGSQLEFRFDGSLDAACPASRLLGKSLSDAMARYGAHPSPIPTPKVIGVAIQPDPLRVRLQADFRIERREGVSYDDNLHFSQAPLRTSDHVAALEEFDQTVVATARAGALGNS